MLRDKVVIITGGAGLLGRAFCESILLNNGIPVIADVNETIGKQYEDELAEKFKPKPVCFHKLDITSEESVRNLIETVKFKYGRIDAFVNNAYPIIRKNSEKKREYGNSFFELNYSDFVESVGMNLGGVFLCSREISRFFSSQGFGNIINVSSIYGVIAPRFDVYSGTEMTMPVDYAVSKSAIIHFTKYLAKYLQGKNIRVNSLSPGGIFNNQPDSFVEKYRNFALNKGMLSKEDVTGTLMFLISDFSRYVNGQNIIIDDGWTL